MVRPRLGVYETFPDPLAELYAFSIAAADLSLPHQMAASLMVSETSVSEGPNNGGGEGWQLVERIPGGEVCSFVMRGPISGASGTCSVWKTVEPDSWVLISPSPA